MERERCVLGADLSLTKTGLVLLGPKGTVLQYELVRPPGPQKAVLEERIAHIADIVLRLAKKTTLVAIEGAAYSMHSAAYNLGMVTGCIRFSLWAKEHPFVIISPSAAKKHATGRGNAKKEEMIAAAQPFFQNKIDDNIADAYFLAEYALAHYDEIVEEGRTNG